MFIGSPSGFVSGCWTNLHLGQNTFLWLAGFDTRGQPWQSVRVVTLPLLLYNSINTGTTFSGWNTEMACQKYWVTRSFELLECVYFSDDQMTVTNKGLISRGRNRTMCALWPWTTYVLGADKFGTEMIRSQLHPWWQVKDWFRPQNLTITVYMD
jgi:hypothetical protein